MHTTPYPQLMTYSEQVADRPVQHQARRKRIRKQQHDAGHHDEHHLRLGGIHPGLGRHLLLEDHRTRHDEGQDPDRKIEAGQHEQGGRNREVGDPENEWRLP